MYTQTQRPPRRRWLSRLLRAFSIGSVVAFAIVALWLLDHLRPRHDYFLNRRGPIVEAEVLEDEVTPEGLHHSLVSIKAESGLTVRFRVIRPDETTEPLPVVVLLAGRRTGSQAVDLIGDPGNLAVAALDYPYEGPEKVRGVWDGVAGFGAMQTALLDTPPAVSVALDWLLDQSWIDGEQAELVGASLGVPFATVAGALDERFQRVWLLHGGADNQEWLLGALRNSVPNPTARAAAASILHLLAHGASFDTAMWVTQIAPRHVVVIGASEDESLTRENIEQLYVAAGEPKELLWTSGGHVTRGRPEVVRELLALVRDRFDTDARENGPDADG